LTRSLAEAVDEVIRSGVFTETTASSFILTDAAMFSRFSAENVPVMVFSTVKITSANVPRAASNWLNDAASVHPEVCDGSTTVCGAVVT
jgi:hypothetical protein